ncbi:MAG: hypothetical protein FWG16_06960 [Micrococcales bacterium]|nr:hypothetical protein [Micrococcales bacterium]
MDEPQPQDLASLQTSLASSIDELRAALKPAAMATRAKAATTGKIKQAALDSSGRPKAKTLVVVSVVISLVVAGLAIRFSGKARVK